MFNSCGLSFVQKLPWEASGITLMKASSPLPRIGKDEFLKGIVFELNDFRKENRISWDAFYQWMRKLCYDILMLPSLSAVKVSLSRLDSKRRLLHRNKQHSMLHELLSDPFLGEKGWTWPVPHKQQVLSKVLDPVALARVNQSLATELSEARALISTQNKDIQDMTQKMSKFSVRNVNKKLRSREGQIVALTQEVKKKRKRLSTRIKKLKLSTERYRINLHNLKKRSGFVADHVQQLESKVVSIEEDFDARAKKHGKNLLDLKHVLEGTREECDKLRGRLNDIESKCIETKEHKMKYQDGIRLCCMELLSLNVGVLQLSAPFL